MDGGNLAQTLEKTTGWTIINLREATMETTRAIVLRKTRLTETSLIVSWLTESHGRLKTVARGVRKAKGAFAGQIDLFYLCEIGWRQSGKSDLHGLVEARLVEPHAAIREHYLRLLFASYAAELVEMATEPEHPALELFDLLRRALGYLQVNHPSRKALVFFEQEICRATGILPENGEGSARELMRHFQRLPDSRRELLEALR